MQELKSRISGSANAQAVVPEDRMAQAAEISSSEWRQEIVRLLSSPTTADWDKARALRDSHLPPRLYRYRVGDDRSFDALCRGAVWLSAAGAFNDVHDTSVTANLVEGLAPGLRTALEQGKFNSLPQPSLEKLEQAEDIVAALDEVFVEEVTKAAGAEVGKRAVGFFRQVAARHGAQMSQQLTAFFQGKAKIGCFCEAYDVPLLWAHYANSHQGFCVEYPIDAMPADDLRRRWLWPVVYSDRRFDLVSLIQRQGGLQNVNGPVLAAMHKAPNWEYEREWRIVDQTGDPPPGREIAMPKPSRIFVGSRMAPQFRDRIVRFAVASRIPVSEIIADTQGFGLTATPVT